MAHQLSKSIKVKLPAEEVWQVLNDYSAIEKYAPTIKSSSIEGDIKAGLGAKRRVTFHHDGSSLLEEIIEFNEGQGYKMAVSELSAPMKSMQAEIGVNAVGSDSCEIYMKLDFELGAGPLGWLLGTLLMKPMMGGVMNKVMQGLAYYTATGSEIDNQLPDKKELNLVVA